MTLEEAESLKAGDMISCVGFHERVIVTCDVKFNELYWRELNSASGHFWAYKDIILVSRAEPTIINNYQIY